MFYIYVGGDVIQHVTIILSTLNFELSSPPVVPNFILISGLLSDIPPDKLETSMILICPCMIT